MSARVERLGIQAAAREVKMVAKLERAAARTVARERRLFERLAERHVNKVKYNPLPTLFGVEIQKFWDLVAIQGPDDCWLWMGSRQSRSNPDRCYGIFNTSNGRWRAHRIAYFIHTEYDPGRLYVCHSCDTPLCVNPQHLWLGTALDNYLDRVAKGRASNKGALKVKLTLDKVVQIRAFLAAGKSQSEIAELYDVHRGTIGNIQRGISWKHIGQSRVASN